MKYVFFLLLGLSLNAQDLAKSILTIDSTLTKNANSIIRQELITVDVTKRDQMTTLISRTITVLNDNGDDKVDSYQHYDDQTIVKNIELYVYDAFGKEIEHYKKRDFKDVSAADGFSLYSDDRLLYVEYIPKSYPYTATFISEVKSNTNAFLPRWKPIRQYASSTQQSTYKILFDPSNTPSYKATNIAPYEISIAEGVSEITCVANLLPAIAYEEHAPQFSSFAPQVMFALKTFSLKGVLGNGSTWSEFGSWMDTRLLKGTEELPAMTVSEINSLVTTEMTDIEKARVVYQYLQDKVRYISVQIGIGGWKPMLASEVDRLSYGDCKALTNYTKALLNAVGVPSYYTVLHSGSREHDFTNDLVAMQGNHVILAIPDGEELVWLECTSQDIPFGHVPNANDDRDVLIVTEEGGKIVHTKSYQAEDNLQLNDGTVRILASGEIQAAFKRESKGLQYDNVYHLERSDQDEKERFYKEKWDYINGIEVTDIVLVNNRQDIIFSETLKAMSTNYISFAGDDMLLTLNVFNQNGYVPPRISERKREVEISIGFTDIDTISFTLPEGFQVDSMPDKKEVKSPFGTYKAEAVIEDNGTISYTRTLIMNKGIYAPDTYDAYRSFLKKIAKLDKTKVLLTQK